ncbi:MAG: LuxR family transcriptional regulator [Pseudomonadota bacterium]
MQDLDATLAAIRSAPTRRKLWTLTIDYFEERGIDRMSYHVAATKTHEAGIVSHGFPDDWVCHYIGDDLIKIDPIPALAAVLAEPFHWSEAALLAEMTPENMAYLDDMRENLPGDGLAFTVFGPRMRNAYVGLGYTEPKQAPDSETILEFQTVAQMAHLRWCALTDAGEEPPPRLSRREHQVLELAAQGKSNSVIAQLLNVSPHTVDTLLRRIYDKLGVADRTSASIKAIGSGLLQSSRS